MPIPPLLAKVKARPRTSGIRRTDWQRRLNIADTLQAFKRREAMVVGQFAVGAHPDTRIRLTHYPVLSRWGS
jgi:hypothetical protein